MNMQWEVIELANSVHVVPKDDILQHALNAHCLCGPARSEDEYVDEPSKPIWVHDAFDGRE